MALLAPYRAARRDPDLDRSRFLSRIRYRIETTSGQLVERYHAKRVWAHDTWHLCRRLLREALRHTVAVLVTHHLGHTPLHLAKLLT